MSAIDEVRVGTVANAVYLIAWTLGVVVCTTYVDAQFEAHRMDRMKAAAFDCMIRERGEWMPMGSGFACSHQYTLPGDPQLWHMPPGLGDREEMQR